MSTRNRRLVLIGTILVAAGLGQRTGSAQTPPSTQPGSGVPPALREEWERILLASREEEQRIRTLQVRYEWSQNFSSALRIQGEDLKPYLASSTKRTMTYVEDGTKYFQDADMRHYDAGVEVPELHFHHIVGFDGNIGYLRRPLRKHAIISPRPAVSHPRMPTPRNLVAPNPFRVIEESVSAGNVNLDAIGPDLLDGEDMIRVQFSAGPGAATIWLAPGKAWLVIRSRSHRAGRLVSESNITETAAIRSADGQEVVYPISATILLFDLNGMEKERLTLHVDRQSVKINEPIDPSRFKISPELGERVQYETPPATVPTSQPQ